MPVNITNSPYEIGHAVDHAARYFNGTLDEVQIFNRSLTEEQIALSAGREFDIPTVALRYAMVAGAYPSMQKIYPNVIKYFTDCALKNESIALHEDGKQSRDFIDIRDLGKAHLAVLDNSAAYYQAFNVGSGKSVQIVNLAELVYRTVGTDFKPVFRGEFRSFTPRHLIMSTKTLKK